MALTLGDNFSYQGAKPLDARLKYDTLAAMKAVADATMYDGCMAYCVATDKTYQWKSTNTVDEDTGKWREFSSGGDTIQVDTLPTAGADELGNVYQYIGSTTLTLTHGYFYECVSDGESTPTYSWEVCDVVDSLSASDVTDIKNTFSTQAFSERGITIDARGTELEVGTYIDANGTSHKLYQKTFYGTIPANTFDGEHALSYEIATMSYVDMHLYSYGVLTDGSGYDATVSSANVSSGTTRFVRSTFEHSNKKLYVASNNSGYNGRNYIITIQYTKTA